MRQDIISKIHSYIREGRLIRRGATVLPKFAHSGLCKEYLRFPNVLLQRRLPSIPLDEALTKRESHPNWKTNRPLTLDNLSLLLTPLSQKEDSEHRYYPSGGALYPIETYIIGSFEGEKKERCVYHYNPKLHALEKLWPTPENFDFGELFKLDTESKKPQAAVIFSAVWERSAKKYGDFAYNLALLEAGHMAQNMLLAATELTIEMCPMGGFSDINAHDLLNVHVSDEQVIYSTIVY